jgi:hypothetical protein
MLRPVISLASLLRRRVPGARERLAYRMLQALVAEPAPRAVQVQAERRPARR